MNRFRPISVVSPAVGVMLRGLDQARLTIVKDQLGVAEALSERLRAVGIQSDVVDEVPPDVQSLIFLKGLDPIHSFEQAVTLEREAFAAARACGRYLVSQPGAFVICQDTGGDFGLNRGDGVSLWAGGLGGLVKTAALEWEQAGVKCLDCAVGERSAGAIASMIFDELVVGGLEVEVSWGADSERRTIQTQPYLPTGLETQPIDDEVLVVSGGARGVTAGCLLHLAQGRRIKLGILGRSALTEEPDFIAECVSERALKLAIHTDAVARNLTISPLELNRRAQAILSAREARQTLDALQRLGAEVLYLSAEIGDADEVAEAVNQVRSKWGRIDGIIHGAGVLADKLIHEKTDSQFRRVFQTKVEGFRNLLQATAGDSLRRICCFSSVSARMGNRGQADYSMANEVLNKVCQGEYRQREGRCIVKSINWGPWDGGMVTESLKGLFEARGVELINQESGAAVFAAELSGVDPDTVEVVCGGRMDGMNSSVESQGEAVETLLINSTTYPHLDDHRIQGVVVVPVVQVIEWFMNVVRAKRPEFNPCRCADLRVLTGIVVPDFEGSGIRLNLSVAETQDEPFPQFTLELRGDDGRLYYSGRVSTDPEEPVASAPRLDDEFDSWTWELEKSRWYTEKLFHGQAFQTLSELDGISGAGCSGRLLNSVSGSEGRLNRYTLDGGLQLALLWRDDLDARASLPLRIEEIVFFPGALETETVRCCLQAKTADDFKTVFDLHYANEAGDVMVRIRGLEMYLTPANELLSQEQRCLVHA